MAEKKALTVQAIENAKCGEGEKPYKLSAGEGLYLEVRPPKSTKYWRLKYRYGGVEKRLALGKYPEVKLAAARDKMREAKVILKSGRDPGEMRKQDKLVKQVATENSFKVVASEWIEKRRLERAAPATLSKLEWLINEKLSPFIGGTPIIDVTREQLLVALRAIEKAGLYETANRAKRVAGQIFRYAMTTGKIKEDVSLGLQDALVTPQVTHRAAITDPQELGKFLQVIEGYKGTLEIKAALKLTPLLFQRPGEIRHMEWAEIDWRQERWEIPAEKMKMRSSHIVPLSRQALEILRDLQPLTGNGKYVLPSARRGGRPMSENGVLAALRTLGFTRDQVTPHGFRATARTILDEVLGVRIEWIEMQLAHAVKDPNGRAYNRTKYLPERRQMMQNWADYLDSLRNESA